MAEDVLYEPAPRYGHVAAAVDGKMYVWGGMRKNLPEVHDGPQKTAITSVVDVLDPQVKLVIIFTGWCGFGRLNKCRAGPTVAGDDLYQICTRCSVVSWVQTRRPDPARLQN